MSFGWSIIRDSGYLSTQTPSIVPGSLVYVAGYSPASYSGAGSTWVDLSGNGNNMTISNATWSAPNSAFSFNGVNSIIYTPDIWTQLTTGNSVYSQTQEVWFKSSALNGTIVTEANNLALTSWHDTQVELVSGTVKARYWNLASPYVTLGSNNSSAWMYACIRYNGTTNIIDGNFNGSFSSTQSFTRQLNPSPAAILYILGLADSTNMGGGAVYYNGLVAVYRTYKRALTNAEILQNYNAEKGKFGY
jgi:hypothetical protein